MGLFGLFRKAPHLNEAMSLYETVVGAARRPVMYTELEVPDTVDGRFDMVAVHAFLVMRRLKSLDSTGREMSQTLFDVMFADMDKNLRELGVSDVAIGGKIKGLARAFYGRIAAYEDGLADEDDEVLGQALRRNLYRKSVPTDGAVAAMARSVRRWDRELTGQDGAAVLAGRVSFGDPVRKAECVP